MFEARLGCYVNCLRPSPKGKPREATSSTGLIATEPGRELRERIVKSDAWDDVENITEIELGRELENHAAFSLRL